MTSYVSPVPFTIIAQSIPPNVFAEMDRKVADAIANGADVIDLAKGNPDAFPVEFVRDVAKAAVDDPANARYSPFDGKPSFLKAAQNWYRNTYGVDLDWKTQLFAVEGAVDGLAALFAVLVSPGDAVAYADPYYPSYHCMTLMSRAEEVLLPSLPERGFLPDLDAVSDEAWRRAKVLILNYPNNPTGAQAPRGFLEHAIELAHEHRFAIVQDFAYAGLGVRDQQASILSLPGAFDVAVEVCSLSKMYAMAGWRAGFIAGNDDIVGHVKQYHYQMGSMKYHYQMGSMITGSVQDAGAAALESDQSCVRELASRYAMRRAIVAGGLRDAGLDVFDSDGGIYAWVHAPKGLTGEQFADLLLERAAVAVLPGTCFGKVGKDYVRFSLLKSEDLLREAVRRVADAL